MPESVTPELSDCLGSAAIVLGLILYRFFDSSSPPDLESTRMESDADDPDPIRGAFFALPREVPGCSLVRVDGNESDSQNNSIPVQAGDV